ncbi:MAG: cysteine--tRNA ligase [bacterium]|nr:cysteine--tRNA ligase [bacterium]
MRDIYLHNTLTGKKEKFEPIKKGQVLMYNCGPTVYDYAHIGNLRSFVLADTLRRTFEVNGLKVHQVINVTDIGHLSSDADDGDDKMTKALKREGKPLTMEAMRELADFYFEGFKEDLKSLNIEFPEKFPFASDHIEEQKGLIQKLLDKEFAYAISDGIYFDTSKDKNYGKLGGSVSNTEEHSRIGLNAEKKNPRDFALWKFSNELGYEASWGKGFPGWHIECSAMSMKYLGETFDVHTGGIDLSTTHHNNEIAQSENATDKPFVNYWLHNAFVNFNDEKMAKSAGTFIKLKDLIEMGYPPLAYRYLLLNSHYRSPMNFSYIAMDGATNAIQKIIKDLSDLPPDGKINKEYEEKFTNFINDDLATAQALALVFEVLKSDIAPADKLTTILKFDEVLGLDLYRCIATNQEEKNIEIPIAVQNLVAEREIARKNKKFETADLLRNEIASLGYIVEDAESGPKVSKK